MNHTYKLRDLFQTTLFQRFMLLFSIENVLIMFVRYKHLRYSAGLPQSGLVSPQMVSQLERFWTIENGLEFLLIGTLMLFAMRALWSFGISSSIKFVTLTLVFSQVLKRGIVSMGQIVSYYPINYVGQFMMVLYWQIFILVLLGALWFFVEYLGVRLPFKLGR